MAFYGDQSAKPDARGLSFPSNSLASCERSSNGPVMSHEVVKTEQKEEDFANGRDTIQTPDSMDEQSRFKMSQYAGRSESESFQVHKYSMASCAERYDDTLKPAGLKPSAVQHKFDPPKSLEARTASYAEVTDDILKSTGRRTCAAQHKLTSPKSARFAEEFPKAAERMEDVQGGGRNSATPLIHTRSLSIPCRMASYAEVTDELMRSTSMRASAARYTLNSPKSAKCIENFPKTAKSMADVQGGDRNAASPLFHSASLGIPCRMASYAEVTGDIMKSTSLKTCAAQHKLNSPKSAKFVENFPKTMKSMEDVQGGGRNIASPILHPSSLGRQGRMELQGGGKHATCPLFHSASLGHQCGVGDQSSYGASLAVLSHPKYSTNLYHANEGQAAASGWRDREGAALRSRRSEDLLSIRVDGTLVALAEDDPSCIHKILVGSNQPCFRKQAACGTITSMAEAGQAGGLLDTGIVAALSQQLKCSDEHCRGDALAAMLVLLSHSPAHSSRAASTGGVMPRLKCKLRCMLCWHQPTTPATPSPRNASQFVADAYKMRALLKLLEDKRETRSNITLALELLEFLAAEVGLASALSYRSTVAVIMNLLRDRCIPDLNVIADLSVSMAALAALLALLGRHGEAADGLDIQPVVRMLQVKSVQLACLAAGVLRLCAAASDGHKLTVARYAIRWAAKWVKTSPEAMHAMLQCMGAVAGYPKAKEYLDEAGLAPVVVWVMGHCDDMECVLAAGHVMTELVGDHRLSQNAFLACNAVPVLMCLLQREGECQRMAAAALLALAQGNKNGRGIALELKLDAELVQLLARVRDPACRESMIALCRLLGVRCMD